MAVTATDGGVGARLSRTLADRLGPAKYGLWFDHSARFGLDDKNRLCVTVPSRFHADWISRNFKDDLRQAARSTTGREVELLVEVRPEVFRQTIPSETGPEAVNRSVAADDKELASNRGRDQDGRNGTADQGRAAAGRRDGTTSRRRANNPTETSHQRYCLDHFVVGPCNELAWQASMRLADGDTIYQPLFIHGGCGLGKTHLLQGICRRFIQRYPRARIRSCTGEQFTNQYITAVRTARLDDFRRSIRRLDLIAVDDVHFLSNKHSTQSEFLCTFDAIGAMGARIVLASDEHPKRIRQLHSRLVSRFVAGLVVEVKPPQRETRRRLFEHKARQRAMRINAAALDALADRCIGSVREIEGTLTQLQAMDGLLSTPGSAAGAPTAADDPGDREIGLILVNRLLRAQQDWAPPARPIRVATILNVVADRFGLESSHLTGSSRHRRIVTARSIAAYLARRLTSMSYPEIARAMSKRHHSTIIAAVRRVEKDLRDPAATVRITETEAATHLLSLLESLRNSIAQAAAAG